MVSGCAGDHSLTALQGHGSRKQPQAAHDRPVCQQNFIYKNGLPADLSYKLRLWILGLPADFSYKLRLWILGLTCRF